MIDVLFACHGHALIAVGKQMLENPPAVHVIRTEPSTEESHEKTTRFRVYVAKMGSFLKSANYEFIAEFENQKLASNYVDFMRGKKRYGDKDIVVQEVSVRQTDQGELVTMGRVACVLTVLGESLPIEEYDFE